MPHDPFDSPAALEAHFRALGFVDQDGLAEAVETEGFYSRALVSDDERPYLVSVQIMSGDEVGHVEVGLTACFDPSERERVNADLAALASALVAGDAGGGECEPFLRAALGAGRDDERDFGDIRLLVVFPEREPDQPFEVAHIEASRPLALGEQDDWLIPEPPAEAGADAEAEAEDACRAILRGRGHRLAGRPMRFAMSSALGEDRLDVLRTDEGASLWLTTQSSGQRTLAIIHPDGRREAV